MIFISPRTISFMKYILPVFIIAFVLLSSFPAEAATSSGYNTFGRSVETVFAFHIGALKDNDAVTLNNRFVLAEDGIVAGLYSPRAFGTRTSATVADNIFRLRQPLERNSFVIFFTNSTNQTFEKSVENSPTIPRKTLGLFSPVIPEMFSIFVRLQYSDIDIVDKTRWISGSRQLRIFNNGLDNASLPMISIGMIS